MKNNLAANKHECILACVYSRAFAASFAGLP